MLFWAWTAAEMRESPRQMTPREIMVGSWGEGTFMSVKDGLEGDVAGVGFRVGCGSEVQWLGRREVRVVNYFLVMCFVNHLFKCVSLLSQYC